MLITKAKLIKGIMGTIYEMAPGCNPRNIDKIHKYAVEWCNTNVKDYEDNVDYENIRKYIKDIMMPCEEFTQLNISQKLWDQGVRDYMDQRNSGFSICAVEHGHDGTPVGIREYAEYIDFIDLSALLDMIAYSIVSEDKVDQGCFLCKNAKSYGSVSPSDCDTCNRCTLNPYYAFNYVPHPKSLVPLNSEEYKNYKD